MFCIGRIFTFQLDAFKKINKKINYGTSQPSATYTKCLMISVCGFLQA